MKTSGGMSCGLNLVLLFHSEITKCEETLIDYKRYKELLFELSPPEWQEAQRTKALKDKDAQDKLNREPEESAIRNGKYKTQVNTYRSGYYRLIS